MGRRAARRTGRRTARRTARRTTHRTARRMRRRRRRRIMVGGMVLLAVGGAAYGAVKLTQKDAQRIEEHTGASVEELTEEELVAAMEDLGIQSIELDENDQAIITQETGQASAGAPTPPAAPAATPAAAPAPTEAAPTYLDELERLAGLRDQGIITDEDFEAKKKQLLGL
ncbi:MAG: SHOCT domain-containing protein [Anaerolineae bacterium]